MGRMEGLIGLALGRSPYDEQIVTPSIVRENSDVVQTGQRFDDHGRPINPETRQRMRDHIRASNEVMQAAGIIEETSDVRARDQAFEDTVNRETEMGLRRLEVGRVLLVAGVWGVCGFRRRILLYKSYSGGLLDLIQRERAQYSAMHMVGTGLPALAVYQIIEWVGMLSRAMISGPNEQSKLTEQTKPNYRTRFLRGMLDYGLGYVMLNFQMFAIIQQLNLWPSDRLSPSLRSLIPFSAHSPLRLPPLPPSLSRGALLSWTMAAFLNIAPLGLVLAHSMLSTIISSVIYASVYKSLPRPTNPDGHFLSMPSDTPEINTDVENDAADSENRDPSGTADGNSTAPRASAAPSQHAATLQALEGRPPTGGDDSSDEDDHEMTQQTLITFDVEPTEMPEATTGTWSAELRSANDPPPKGTLYQVTALTMLPPLLAAESLSFALASIPLLPVEALMVRTVARGYARRAGLGTEKLFLAGASISLQSLLNVFAVNAVELAVTVAVWAAFTAGSQAMAGKHLMWNLAVDETNREGTER